MQNFVKYCLENGGSVHPLLVDPSLTNGTGLMNPSIFFDGDKILCNVRHVNYTLFHSEGKKFHHYWGPLQYIHPENDCRLITTNYLCHLDNDLNITRTDKIDTSTLDVEPIWEFVGLEDVRLFKWDDKLYGSGVRRDTTVNGVGRMELSEYVIDDTSVKEISRFRIPAPGPNTTYCEKNWMPILDKPYHYIKWSNPTEVVKIDPFEKSCKTVHLEEQRIIPGLCDFRGGSQVIPWNNHYLAIIHEVRLFNSELGRKDGKYYHRFVLWDSEFNIVRFSDLLDFMEGDIEFSCGLAFKDGVFYSSFGFQDNAAFILKFPELIMYQLLDNITETSNNIIPATPVSNPTSIPVIGVPIVNGTNWLKNLIESVDYPVDNLVIINNNGRDQITDELNLLVSQPHKFIKKLQVCHLPGNIGCSGAWNLIIKSFIMAPYWIITNNDIAFTPGFLEKMVTLAITKPKVGIVHAAEGQWKFGSWEIFLIKDFVIRKYGLFDENLYPAYEEDMDYFMRILADGQILEREMSVGLPFYHGGVINNYDDYGSQTSRCDPDLKSKIDKGQTINQDEYMDIKWGKNWRYCGPTKFPFNDDRLPLTYTTYDIDFIRKKYMGF